MRYSSLIDGLIATGIFIAGIIALIAWRAHRSNQRLKAHMEEREARIEALRAEAREQIENLTRYGTKHSLAPPVGPDEDARAKRIREKLAATFDDF